MSPQQKNISIIHNCEEHLFNWLKIRLHDHGVLTLDHNCLSDILSNYEKDLEFLRQHIKTIKKWNQIKEECYSLSSEMNGSGDNDEHLQGLIEKAAFEGQVLWLTIQED